MEQALGIGTAEGKRTDVTLGEHGVYMSVSRGSKKGRTSLGPVGLLLVRRSSLGSGDGKMMGGPQGSAKPSFLHRTRMCHVSPEPGSVLVSGYRVSGIQGLWHAGAHPWLHVQILWVFFKYPNLSPSPHKLNQHL